VILIKRYALADLRIEYGTGAIGEGTWLSLEIGARDDRPLRAKTAVLGR
jgi:hypothetical protein